MSYQTEAKAVLFRFLDGLATREKKQFVLLADQWQGISKNLETLIKQIAEKEVKSENDLFRLSLYQQFLAESKLQVLKYSSISAGVITNEQKIYAQTALDATQEVIGLQTKLFQHLPIDAVQNFIGKSYYDGAKLNDTLFARSYSDFVGKTKDILLQGVALGKSPSQVARMVTKESNAPLWQSLRLARTEQMSIFRETSSMQMEKSGVVDAQQRIEEGDACPECQAANGQIYQFGEDFDTHPNCRGTLIPYFNS